MQVGFLNLMDNLSHKKSHPFHTNDLWWTRLESNQRPADYESDALTPELHVRGLQI